MRAAITVVLSCGWPRQVWGHKHFPAEALEVHQAQAAKVSGPIRVDYWTDTTMGGRGSNWLVNVLGKSWRV